MTVERKTDTCQTWRVSTGSGVCSSCRAVHELGRAPAVEGGARGHLWERRAEAGGDGRGEKEAAPP